jgi:predicted permease
MRPSFWRRIPGKWSFVLRIFARKPEEDVDAELRFHFDERIAELTARGVQPDIARTTATTEFGDVETVRNRLWAIDRRLALRRRRADWWEGAAHDLWIALRRLRRTPAFTIAATLTLSIAIGATASVFSVVDGVLLKAFPLHEPERVLLITENNPARHLLNFAMSPLTYIDYRDQSRSFAELASSRFAQMTVTGTREPERVTASLVSPNYFAVLGLAPVLGRALAPDSAGPPEVVIGYGLWQRRFAGASSVLGQTLILDDLSYTVVGVMPPGLPGDIQVWTRLSFQPSDLVHRDWHYLGVFGRLKAGVAPEEARQGLEVIAGRLARAYPQTNGDWSIGTMPLLDQLVGPLRPALLMLLVAAGCVLLVGVANLANLFLVRCLARGPELAMRTALGATRLRLLRELLLEAGALSAAGGAAGVGVAIAGVRLLRQLAPATLPRLNEITVDGRVAGFCALTSVLTVFVFGALPAWRASFSEPAQAMTADGRGTSPKGHHRLQDTLVVLQVAIALVLLTGTGLMVESFQRFRQMDLGFRPEGVLTARLALPEKRYDTAVREGSFASTVVERLAALPGVDAAAASSALPGSAGVRWAYTVVGDPTSDYAHAPTVRPVFVTPDYFRTMGIAVRRGRGIFPSDARRTVKVAVIDDRLAKQAFHGRDPIGSRLVPTNGPDVDTVEVVGVVASVKQGGLVPEEVPWVYLAIAQAPEPGTVRDVAVHTISDPDALASALKRVLAGLDGSVPAFDIKSMDATVADSVSLTRFSTFLASLFSVIALILGVLGIYSVLAYVVAERKREIAIRLALGATGANVMSGVIRRALTLTGVGVALGSGAAWWLTRATAGLFEGVSPHDPRVFAGAAVAFMAVALAAAAVPAFRTTRIDPVATLRTT